MKTICITGGAGFIGSNVAAAHLAAGDQVRILDNLSRRGTERNWDWLGTLDGSLERIRGDIRDQETVERFVEGADVVYHLASQVAVTTSVTDPRTDFEVNALGTFNVLEAVRTRNPEAVVLYASTNKVYGGMDDAAIDLIDGRWGYLHLPDGVPASQPLDFHSPYGCSKGAGDQYVRDYARIYNLKTVVFRQSCIYGRRQFGNEDQGWVAHFVKQALAGEPITIFGDGRQVRDLLWIDDLIGCYQQAIERIDAVRGEVFNVGGGMERTASLIEVIQQIESFTERPLERSFGDWRPGDQRVYVSDTTRAEQRLGWRPTTNVTNGIRQLVEWMRTA